MTTEPFVIRSSPTPTPTPKPPPDAPPNDGPPATECDCNAGILKDVNTFLLAKLHQAACAPPCASKGRTPTPGQGQGSQLIDGTAGITTSSDNGVTFSGAVGQVDAWSAGTNPGLTVETFEITNPTTFSAVAIGHIVRLARQGAAPPASDRISSLVMNTSTSTTKYWALLAGDSTTVTVTSSSPSDTLLNGSVVAAPATPNAFHAYELYLGTTWSAANAAGPRGRLYRYEMKPTPESTEFFKHWFLDQYYFSPDYEDDSMSNNTAIFLKRVETFPSSLATFMRADLGLWTRHEFAYRWNGLT